MASLLLAESGSTKTDWCLVQKTGKTLHFKTSGINPYLQSSEQILSLLEHELSWNEEKHKTTSIAFYGAGASRLEQQKKLADVLKQFFGSKAIEVHCDMMAAARAMCGENRGIVCILGTGSNSCFYDGKKIKDRQTSLGYIAGDEGSGNYLGKRVLQYYAYHTFDEELMMCFEQLHGNDIGAILRRLYSEPFPNRYLATFVQLLKENRGHYMVENIIEDCLNDFFHAHLMKYRQSWNTPLYFTGSIAYEFKDVIGNLCHQYEIELGAIEKSPMDNLVKFHRKTL
ncbi:MAG TPA: N-acetylglucosamine kinase [Flavipsychrobacter sp.]|nr:N-acetylglucosamine kinase [Flavipsychrobacter sp.]